MQIHVTKRAIFGRYCRVDGHDFSAYWIANGVTMALILVIFVSNCAAQQIFRRHFIVAYDVSSPFIKAERSLPAYRKAVADLFANQPVQEFQEAYQNNLAVEKKNGLVFFDAVQDEISFYHFNIARTEFSAIQRIGKSGNPDQITQAFIDTFLKDKALTWSRFQKEKDATIASYVDALFKCPVVPSDFGGGVSMSNFVYPLVLGKMDAQKYAEEYVLVLLSDFKTGSMLGNKLDLDRVRDIFQVPYGAYLSSKSPVTAIKNEIDFLASRYYKIDFFEYAFKTTMSPEPIGVVVSKIKPKVGVLTPEDVALFVDGNWELDQLGYRDNKFRTSPTEIRFTHNKDLAITELRLTICRQQDGIEKIVFDDVMARRNADLSWASNYTSRDDLMAFDKERNTYHLPTFDLEMDTVMVNADFDHLRSRFAFQSQYKTSDSQQLNFIYATERTISRDNVHYSTKTTRIIMYIVLPIVILIALIAFLILYGRPRGITLSIDGYLDSFEVVDFAKSGRMTTPYLAWNSEDPIQYLVVTGNVRYKSPNFPMNWKSSIAMSFMEAVVPSGFDLFLKPSVDVMQEFESGITMPVNRQKNNDFKFVVGIRQNDITASIDTVMLVKFKIEAKISDTAAIAFKAEVRNEMAYAFHLGGDMGDVCVAFDPGTTGSCVAIGSSNDNIILIKDRRESDIIPSMITFETSEELHRNDEAIPPNIYRHGSLAFEITGKSTNEVFQSFKKLLGFKDVKKIKFKNNAELALSGKDLGSLLVKGLYKDLEERISKMGEGGKEYLHQGKIDPRRAVVAIPNNFTASKMQDMLDCIGNLGQFKEIRYVYEAEAVLFYYLSNYQRLNGGGAIPETETILIFDMGGATINATMVTSTLVHLTGGPKYQIEFLGKIGYGIGGDTIDYCIIQFILSFSQDYPTLRGIKDHASRFKNELSRMALEIKKEIIQNWRAEKDFLISEVALEGFIKTALRIDLQIDPSNSRLYAAFLKDENGDFPIFLHALFRENLYNQVTDACNELISLAGTQAIHKVILSGRSTAFPLIKEIVEGRLMVMGILSKFVDFGFDESKTAVAMGACWYGLNKNAVELNHLKTSASFGFRKTLSADTANVQFYELIETSRDFDGSVDGLQFCDGQKAIKESFALDNGKVNFYQIMGKDADFILSNNQKHKYSKIASIAVPQMTSLVAMRVNENDIVECVVELESSKRLRTSGFVSDQEIGEANDEHYTWNVK